MKNKLPDIDHNLTDRTGSDPVTDTIAFWNAHAGIDVSQEDAREMVKNLIGFFRLLDQWDQHPGPES